jgi:uncharacterized protein (DUF1778 family)
MQTQEPVTISILAQARQCDLIDQAAEQLGRSRSDFILDASCREAEDVLLDQIHFEIDAKAFAKFETMLDNPPEPSDSLRRLLTTIAPWE